MLRTVKQLVANSEYIKVFQTEKESKRKSHVLFLFPWCYGYPLIMYYAVRISLEYSRFAESRYPLAFTVTECFSTFESYCPTYSRYSTITVAPLTLSKALLIVRARTEAHPQSRISNDTASQYQYRSWSFLSVDKTTPAL